MTTWTFAAGGDIRAGASSDYRPGVCNIGSAEIRRRRMAGHAGLVATLALFVVLVVLDAPRIARFLVILPAAGSAAGYLQAWLRFCAGFGWRGVFNFGRLGEATAVTDSAALAADRGRARQISILSLASGVAAGVAAFFLPI
jgi:hypothetical protein